MAVPTVQERGIKVADGIATCVKPSLCNGEWQNPRNLRIGLFHHGKRVPGSSSCLVDESGAPVDRTETGCFDRKYPKCGMVE